MKVKIFVSGYQVGEYAIRGGFIGSKGDCVISCNNVFKINHLFYDVDEKKGKSVRLDCQLVSDGGDLDKKM